MRRIRYCRRAGLTLVELIVSMIAAASLLAGMSASILIAVRAAQPNAPTARAILGSAAAVELAEELRWAQSLSERTATSVEFVVVRYDQPQTIRYAWSAVAGDPLTRQYNGGAIMELVPEVEDFALRYEVETVVDRAGTRHYLQRIDVMLQAGEGPATQVHTAADLLGRPQVSGP